MTGRKLYKHIYRGFIAVALVITVIFSLCFYISSYESMKSKFGYEAGAALDQFAKRADIRLSMMKEAAARLSRDEAIAAYAQAEETDESVLLVQEAIRRNVADFGAQGMSIYVSKLDSSLERVIGEGQTPSVYDFLNSYQFGNGSGESIKQYFTRSENEGKIFVRYCVKSTLRNTNSLFMVEREMIGENAVYVICSLDMGVLTGSQIYRDGSFAILDGQNIVCNVGSNTLQTTDGINEIIKKNDMGTLTGAAAQGRGYLYRAVSSDIYRWNYVLAVPTVALGEGAVQIFFAVLALCVVWLFACWGLLKLVMKWIYRPIDTMLRCMPGYGTALADEAAFAASAVATLSRERDALAGRLEDVKEPLRAKFMRDMLLGLVTGDRFSEQAAEYGLTGLSGPYRVVLLEFVNYDLLVDAFTDDAIHEIKYQIEEFIGDQLKEQVIAGVVEIDATKMAVISYGTDVRKLRELLMDMAMMVEGSFDVEIAGAIGDDCDELFEISKSYQSSCRIMENRVSVGSRSAIVTAEDVNAANTGGFYYPLNVERELITAVIRAHGEETDRIIDDILNENFRNRTLTKDRMNAFAFAITATLNRVLESLNKTSDEVFGDGDIVFLDLKMCRDPEELGVKIHEVFHKVITHIDMENKIAEDDLSNQMLAYIHSHYNEDISLLDIGGHFNLSQCYTSTLFKDTTGENFKDYLSRYRIKKAKEILAQDPGIKNNELAKMIGCNTVATLFRLFNKYEGMSPGQYVKSMKA